MMMNKKQMNKASVFLAGVNFLFNFVDRIVLEEHSCSIENKTCAFSKREVEVYRVFHEIIRKFNDF